jgi:hypothetical protein
VATIPSSRPLCFVAIVASLVFAGAGQSRPGKPNPKGPPAANTQVKEREAGILVEAYTLLCAANFDYNGHKVNAMGHMESAIKKLDRGIMKNGANGQKAIVAQQDIQAAHAAFVARHKQLVHEPQALSDAQVREALRLLIEVHKALAQHKQPEIRKTVGAAIHQLEIALRIR